MVAIPTPTFSSSKTSSTSLLRPEEVILVVDGSAQSGARISGYLSESGMAVASAASAAAMFQLIGSYHIACVILDMKLPDRPGDEVLADLATSYPDLGIIIVADEADLQGALHCLRRGADDYLIKPIDYAQLTESLKRTLHMRQLAIDNRVSQQQLHNMYKQARFLHGLNLKMNNVYLGAQELIDQVMRAILVGITSDDGLRFNRAFLALFNEDQSLLKGVLAIGPGSREEAGRVWEEMRGRGLDLHNLFSELNGTPWPGDTAVNEIAHGLVVPATHTDHPLIHACINRTSILVTGGKSVIEIDPQLIQTLGVDCFVIVPLYSPRREHGVIIADNFVTGRAIAPFDVEALEIFAGQASLAIEQSHLYREMHDTIEELKTVTDELEAGKNLLVETERYTALGQMAGQLVHALRNPITAIGGTARLLARRAENSQDKKFLDLIAAEAATLEATLADLFTFVDSSPPDASVQPLFALVRRSVMAFYTTMKNQGIYYQLDLTGDDPHLLLDEEKIRQAFMQIIRNSIEAMPDGGILNVSSARRDDRIVIRISDTGKGITGADLQRVTNPFYTTKTFGTGLGLTLVEQILESHGAHLHLSANTPHGTIAAITFIEKPLPESQPTQGA
jgi:signal transduction histidine kinase/FixJ family two-component response regulator